MQTWKEYCKYHELPSETDIIEHVSELIDKKDYQAMEALQAYKNQD